MGVWPPFFVLGSGHVSDVTVPNRDFGSLHPLLRLRLLDFFQACGRGRVSVFVTEGFRAAERQAHLHASGRERTGPILTHAKPGQSYHNLLIAGRPCSAAVDVAVWDEDEGWSKTLEWKGTAREWDVVHAAAAAAQLQTLIFERPHLQLPFPLEDLAAGAHWVDLGPVPALLNPQDPYRNG